MRFLNDLLPQHDLTYDDVFMVPNRSSVTSRLDVDLGTVDGTGTTIPLVVANMTAIAGRRMAETTARRGALTVIPQDIPAEIVRDVVTWQKSRHLVYDTPITLTPTMTVGEALVLLHKRAHGAAIVTVGDRPVGIVTETDLTGVDRFTQIDDVMVRDMVTLEDGVDVESAFDTLSHARRRLAPIVAEDGRLVGILTRSGALRAHLYVPALDDAGRLRIAAAVGINGDVATKAKDAPRRRRRRAGDRHRARPPGEDDRGAARGARARPGGAGRGRQRRVGPGHPRPHRGRCRHRQGGRGARCHVHDPDDDRRRAPPVLRRARVRHGGTRAGPHVWADGGVRHPRDVALALAAGASNVMIGSWFAGTLESPGDLYTDEAGRHFKESFGMASSRAVRAPHRERHRLRAGP